MSWRISFYTFTINSLLFLLASFIDSNPPPYFMLQYTICFINRSTLKKTSTYLTFCSRLFEPKNVLTYLMVFIIASPVATHSFWDLQQYLIFHRWLKFPILTPPRKNTYIPWLGFKWKSTNASWSVIITLCKKFQTQRN